MNKKIFVIDTSIFAYDPVFYKNYVGSTILIPITVLEELDKIKKYANEAGKNARVATKNLDIISNKGNINKGVKTDGVLIKIDVSNYGAIGSDPTYGDAKILACAIKTKKQFPKCQIILMSKDINLRVRAKALNISAEDYEKETITPNDLYTGFREIKNEDAGLALFDAGAINALDYEETKLLYPNECVLFLDKHGKGIAPGRRVKDQIRLIKDRTPWGLELRNKEQLFATDLLLDPNVPFITLVGLAGSGKSLIAVANALEMVINKRFYDTFSIYRPIQPMGNDIGYTPGTIQEKLEPWFAPIDDAFSLLLSDGSRKKEAWKMQLHQYMSNGTIQKEALTYIRGRSLHNSFILGDEIQNLSPEEVKTILTRVGNNTKIVFTGDLAQIDNPKLDAINNGLTYVIEKFKTSDLAGHITFQKGERSALATKAAEIL